MSKRIIHERVIDDRGRCISPKELRWIRRKIRDPYDHRWLALCLNVVAGLRIGKSCSLRFPDDFKRIDGKLWLKTWQNKAHRVREGENIRLISRPRFVPLADWLDRWITAYIRYRVLMATSVGADIEGTRLFPGLYPQLIQNLFYKLRMRYGQEHGPDCPEGCEEHAPWLNDIWKEIVHYDAETGEKVKSMRLRRVSSHSGRAFYSTAAYKVVGEDPIKGTRVSGHERMKDYMKYAKSEGLMEAKVQIRDQIMNPLMDDNGLPFLKGQKRIDDF